jgi:calcineurin-like phosphoesterase family protein
MTTWFTADLHFGHTNIISYAARPFADVDEMDAALRDRWNECVADDDEVWVLGDVALGRLRQTLPLVGDLKGRKLLVAGNHDRCWQGTGWRARRWTRRYLDAGFVEVHQTPVHLEVGGHRVLASHFPYHGDSLDADRFVEHRPVDAGLWLLHGHVHSDWRQLDKMINVGVDAWRYRPVSEAVLAELIEAGAGHLSRLRA